MPGLVAALAVSLALAAGPGTPAAQPQQAAGWRERNAARAKQGLLPRKPPARKPRAYDRRGRRILRLAAPPPTFLGEPAPLAAGAEGPLARPAGWVEDPAAPGLRLAAEGVATEMEIAPRRPGVSLVAGGVEASALLRPRSRGLALAATGVVTEVALTLPGL